MLSLSPLRMLYFLCDWKKQICFYVKNILSKMSAKNKVILIKRHEEKGQSCTKHCKPNKK